MLSGLPTPKFHCKQKLQRIEPWWAWMPLHLRTYIFLLQMFISKLQTRLFIIANSFSLINPSALPSWRAHSSTDRFLPPLPLSLVPPHIPHSMVSAHHQQTPEKHNQQPTCLLPHQRKSGRQLCNFFFGAFFLRRRTVGRGKTSQTTRTR